MNCNKSRKVLIVVNIGQGYDGICVSFMPSGTDFCQRTQNVTHALFVQHSMNLDY